MTLHRMVPAVSACALLVACGGGGGGQAPPAGGSCGIPQEKQLVLDATNTFYLFLELLPASIDPAQFATADDLLDAMTATARAQSKDRFFSFLTSISAEQQFFAGAESVGFGIGLKVSADNTRVFVTQVFAGSAAADALFTRSDEILQIGTSQATLVDVATLLAQPNGLNDALGPVQSGVTRVFRVSLADATEETRSVTKRAFSLDPVPQAHTIPRTGLSPVGYVNLRTFVSPADNLLRNAFAQFTQENVRDLIIDLRYNGGGLVSTAEILGSLLAQQAGASNALMHRTQFNARRAAIDVNFRAEAQAIEPVNIAFLTTSASASASELVINSLSPYANTVIVGARSFGKPVGQEAFDLQGCDTRLRLVTFKSVNRDNFGDYFTGLHPDAGFVDAFCDAPDDLSRPQGDPAEDMTEVALSWINTGTCVQPVLPKLGAAMRDEVLGLVPLPRRPTAAQVFSPGLF
ncbi:MAG: S41 family peptidase [Gammaproteobacteria bacterium]